MNNSSPMINVDLPLSCDFSGRILLYLEGGHVVANKPVLENELVGSVELFTQLLQRAGYRVEANCEE
ncbi:hypothetical protein [Rouxiella badensis]|uniref:hypothetical protein n=1 Tax=Rouxiella badensis TaxID=1646377 RepID=UPI0017888D18|nr:hypothetical protein [Rouxiella badensis]QOI56577.1 hypothetical protein H2866_05430 [Rouxiella badensis subsp. acadiensis]